MKRTTLIFVIFNLALWSRCDASEKKDDKEDGLFECILEESITGCLRTRMARDMDRIEVQVTGRKSELPISTVIEQAANLIAEAADDFQNPDRVGEAENEPESDGEVTEEGRRKKLGKKKKKHLQKLLGLAMLLKAKLGLILQLISTHFQLKFFVIAIISLVLNAARFWIDLKKGNPSKVIYYEHAQHQHHYDHEEADHDHYWGRASKDSPQNLAYSAYAPEN